MKAQDVTAAVLRHYGCARADLTLPQEWAALPEFQLHPGGGDRRIDLFLIRAWSGRVGHVRHAVEVKVNRADLRAELAQPEKSAPFRNVAHRFWLAAPAGLIRDEDPIPPEWGIYEVTPTLCRVKRNAATNPHPDPFPYAAAVEAFRRASRAEERIRHAVNGDPAAHARLRREVESLRGAEIRAGAALSKARRRAEELAGMVAAVLPLPCASCGTDVRLVRGHFRHATPSPSGCHWPHPDLDKIPEQGATT